jgi:hypothetical protein
MVDETFNDMMMQLSTTVHVMSVVMQVEKMNFVPSSDSTCNLVAFPNPYPLYRITVIRHYVSSYRKRREEICGPSHDYRCISFRSTQYHSSIHFFSSEPAPFVTIQKIGDGHIVQGKSLDDAVSI